MNTLQAIQERYSYRKQYKPDPVPREHLRTILEAGMAAPSGCNTQTTSMIAVDDPALVKEIGSMLKAGFGSAPAGICVITQGIVAYDDVTLNVQDYSAAIENMLLAVTELGYASCWVEGQVAGDEKVSGTIARLLGVPEEYAVVAYLPVGIPAQESTRAQKKPFEQRCWFNGFGK